jgi:hypothetical protein
MSVAMASRLTVQTDRVTRRTASHYETWLCNKCGHEERNKDP